MRVVTVAATKGGVGKSTLACALAVCALEEGAKVGIYDADPQGSMRSWFELREGTDGVAMPVLLSAETMSEAEDEAEELELDWLFCDTPPAIIDIIEPCVRSATLVVVPCRPSPVDLLAIDPIVGLCELHKRPWVFVLNQVPPRTSFAAEAGELLRGAGKVMSVDIGHRNIIAMAMATGRTGPELERGETKARDEIGGVWREVKRLVRKAEKKVAA